MSEIPAGWYPDPYETPNLYRWWDGVRWTDDTAPMSPEQVQQPTGRHAQPQEQWQGAPRWEPPAVPPPWDTQHGPPGLGDAPNADAPPGLGSPPLDPFAPYPQVPSAHDSPSAAQAGQAPPWAPADAAWSQPEADWGQQAQHVAGWGQQGQAPVPPGESHGPAGGWGGPPTRGPDVGGPVPPRKSRGPLIAGIAGGLALLLVVAAAVGVFLVRRGHQQADPSQSPTGVPTQSTGPASSQPASPVPTGPRITAGSISYVRLPAPWVPNTQQQFSEFDTKAGQYQYTQRNPPGVEGGWIANVYVGSLSDQFSYGGPDDLKSSAGELASTVEQKYYKPWKLKRKDLAQKQLTVDGKQAYEIKFHLDFLNTPKGFAAKGETVLVAVVDSSTGGQGVYISIPDNAKKLEPTFDLVMNSLQVD